MKNRIAKIGTSHSKQSGGQVAPVVSGWNYTKLKMKIWLLAILSVPNLIYPLCICTMHKNMRDHVGKNVLAYVTIARYYKEVILCRYHRRYMWCYVFDSASTFMKQYYFTKLLLLPFIITKSYFNEYELSFSVRYRLR